MNLNFSAAITILTKQEIIPTLLSLNFLIKYHDNLMEKEFKYFLCYYLVAGVTLVKLRTLVFQLVMVVNISM